MIKKLLPLLLITSIGAPLHAASEEVTDYNYAILMNAVQSGNIGAIRQFIASHPEAIRVEHYHTQLSSLDVAINMGAYEITKLLLENGAYPHRTDSDEDTYLHNVARAGNLPLVELLLRFGVPINVENEGSGSTPLHRAAEGGHLDVVRYLVKHGANTNAEDDQENTPLLQAIAGGKVRIAAFLAHHTSSEDMLNDAYDKALFMAADHAHLVLVKYFLLCGARMERTEQDYSVLDQCNEPEFRSQTSEEKNKRAKTMVALLTFGAPLGKYGAAILQRCPRLKQMIESHNRAAFNCLKEYVPQVLQHEILSFASPVGIGNLEEESDSEESDKRQREDADQEDSGSDGPALKKQRNKE